MQCLKKSNSKNKSDFANLLLSDWITKHEQRSSPGHEIYLADGFHDIVRVVKVGPSNLSAAPELEADMKADSCMFLHVPHAKQTLGVNKMLMWSLNSDAASMNSSILGVDECYFKDGDGQKKRFIPMHRVATELGTDMCFMLPNVHTITGCDYFSLQGKKSWLQSAAEHPELGLKHLGNSASQIQEETEGATGIFIVLW